MMRPRKERITRGAAASKTRENDRRAKMLFPFRNAERDEAQNDTERLRTAAAN